MEYLRKYVEWVKNNPSMAGEMESLSKLVSVLLPNRLPNSVLFSELFYSLSNFLVLINNQILKSSLQAALEKSPGLHEKFQAFFSVLDYCSAFFEIGAHQLWGQKGRWLIITIIQVLRTVWRLFVLARNQTGLALTRPVKIVSKKDLSKPKDGAFDDFIILSSGRMVRKVSCNGMGSLTSTPSRRVTSTPTTLTGKYLIAEIIDALKPVAYLGTARLTGSRSWAPWLVSLLMDSASLICYSDIKSLNTEEKAELFRRRTQLLMYLLRSPLYDRFTKEKISVILLYLSRHVPLVHYVCLPLLKYIPVYQKLYFYTWNG